MGLVDVDVVAKPGKKDLALQVFRTELERQEALAKVHGVSGEKKLVKDVVNVFDMVDRIIPQLGSMRIRRLRIFGHGSANTVQVGPFLRTFRQVSDVSQPQRIDQADLDKVIQIIKTESRTLDGQVAKVEYNLLSEDYLKRLKGRFDPRGWVELHSCRIVGQDGKALIDGLAKLWQVEVQASEDKQYVGGGLEGRVWIAKQKGKPFLKVSPQQKPSGANPSIQIFLAGHNPLREALRNLGAGRTAISPITPGTTYSDLSTRKTFKVDAMGGHVQTGSLMGLAAHRVDPTMHSFLARYDPLQEATRRLHAGRTAISSMSPGTTYSDLSTRKTFKVDAMGGHVQTGSPLDLAAHRLASPTVHSFQARYDPLRAAVRKLGG